MTTLDSTNVAAGNPPSVGFLEWIWNAVMRSLGMANVPSSPEDGPLRRIGEREGEFVIAAGGYRIRVPHPSDVGHSVGELLPSVREGLALLPPLPSVIMELLREIQDPKSTASSVADVASSDPALAASLLRTANGASMGLSRTITSVSDAVSYLGFGTVKAMVIRLRLDEVLMPKTEQAARDAEDLWVHSMAVSYAAECLAQQVGDIDRGFVATLGLLHDIGKLAILAQLPEQDASLRNATAAEINESPLAAEARVLGVDHAGLGGNLAAKWKLPADLVQAIRWHHRPATGFHPTDPPALRKALHVVQIANQLVKYCYPHADRLQIDVVPDEAFAMLGMESSMSSLLTPRVRDAISRAIYFADGNTRRPISAPRRFLQPLRGKEAADAVATPTGNEMRIAQDDALVAALFSQDAPELNGRSGARIPTAEIRHARFSTQANAPSVQKCIVAVVAHQEALCMPTTSKSSALTTVKSLIPNVLALSAASDSIEIAQRIQGGKYELAVRANGLAAARRLGVPATEEIARRLAEADMANLLNLGWFERISISSDGSAIVFTGRC